MKNIKAEIDEINKLADSQQSDKTLLVLYTYLSVFEFVDEPDQLLKPFFVDSPGVEDIRDDIKQFYTIDSSLVYIENYCRFINSFYLIIIIIIIGFFKKRKNKKRIGIKARGRLYITCIMWIFNFILYSITIFCCEFF